MSFTTTTRRTLGFVSALAITLMLGLFWTGTVQAKNFQRYSLTGNSRNQIGNGLPLPITLGPPPNGKIQLNGFISQTTGPMPKAIVNNQPRALRWGPQTATIPLFLNNTKVFQIRTSLIIAAPHAPAVFKANGRTGPTHFTWCPGLPLPTGTTTGANPSCTAPNMTTTPTATQITIKANIKYQKTVNQFGGVSQPDVGGGQFGGAQLALKVFAGAPCNGVGMTTTTTCLAIFSNIVPAATGVGGGPIGNSNMFAPPSQPIHPVNVTAAGHVTAVGPHVASFMANAGTTVGGPYTTGIVVVSAPNAANGGEKFTLSGMDSRNASGVGAISLVSGGVSHRALSGDNANRGWLNYNIGALAPVPSLSNGALIALAGLLLASAVWMVRRSFAAAR